MDGECIDYMTVGYLYPVLITVAELVIVLNFTLTNESLNILNMFHLSIPACVFSTIYE